MRCVHLLILFSVPLLSCKALKEYSEHDSGTDTEEDVSCTGDVSCSDGNPCNGEETCNLASHTCVPGSPREDGFVCGTAPRQICLEQVCRESTCGDGYVDTGAGEGCEPPGVGNCTDECVVSCESDLDCEDDGNICNGEEYCNLTVNECDHRNALADGTACGTSPRRICLSESCQDSTCGDGYIDDGVSPPEECEDLNTVEGDGCDNDCTFSCHVDGECDDGHDCTQDRCSPSTHVCFTSTLGPTVVCRAAGGDCDVAETCDGVGADCPVDGFVPSTTVCRAAADQCDAAEYCTGLTASCPADLDAPSGTSCDDGDPCTDPDTCDGSGSCVGVEITGCCEIEHVSGGGYHTCVLMTTGDVKCWGDNSQGQVGDGSTLDRSLPVPVSGLSGIAAISAGRYSTCVLTGSGGVKCWGDNVYGQLGNGTTTDSRVPVDATGLSSGVSMISAGGWHECALMTSGAVKCWGSSGYGQLGRGSTTDSSIPVDVTVISSTATSVCAGGAHTCVILSSGAVMCWGYNSDGQLGDGSSVTYSVSAVAVTGLPAAATQISCGRYNVCALLSTGAVMCWGKGEEGELGNGGFVDSSVPVTVSGYGSGGVQLSLGDFNHMCLLDSSGRAKCWGENLQGQLGNGTTVNSAVPVDVTSLTSGVSMVAAGGYHSCALTSTGGLKCWGDNADGQLGDGSTTDRLTPVDVTVTCP
jgi:cysteine-rich repeat protein